MLRILLITHRYLAVAVGLLMALWCLSGFVMMYQPYPSLTAAERVAALAPLELAGCCQTGFLPDDDAPAGDFRVEMQAGRPVLRQPGAPPFDLLTGVPIRRLQQQDLLQIATVHAAGRGLDASPRWLREIEVDQWTLQSARRHRPVQRIALEDAAGTELYLDGQTGEVFQDTNRRERVLNWLGAIPHWLYPTFLRRNGPLWAQVVIWTSVAGTFLALTGLYVGVSRLRGREGGRRSASPFRGWWYWHHMAGLFFGVLTLTWVFSGLLSMNPWGWLEGGEPASRIRQQLAGVPHTAALRQFLREAPRALVSGEYTLLQPAPLAGELYVLAQRADGSSVRLNSHARHAPMHEADVRMALAGLGAVVASLERLTEEDAYYYGHKRVAPLPVWRAVLDDADRTHVYLSPDTGDMRVLDQATMRARWLQQGLHSLDFSRLRWRPLWDIVTMLLLAGVTVLCITGSWMALQRIRKDLGTR